MLLAVDTLRGERDPDADRETDDYGPGAGGKKRKIPAYPQIVGQDEDDAAHSKYGRTVLTQNFRLARSRSAKACSFRKALFLRRKAALITLYLDAQSAISAGTDRVKHNTPALPEVAAFEKLLPALEDLMNWAPDKPGWRNDGANQRSSQEKLLEDWRTSDTARRRIRTSRKPIIRGGWTPEGSFEFDIDCKASAAARARVRDQAALHRLADELRAIVLLSSKPPQIPPTTSSAEKSPTKIKLMLDTKAESARSSWSLDVASQEGSELASRTKPKKKKRSILANQSNPHHVDNYRPSRTVSPHDDPYDSYPQHSYLLFSPPMRLLSARPQRKTAPLPGGAAVPQVTHTAPEDDYICCFCETALFFGTEKARKSAIRQRRAEIKRRETIRAKAKNVVEGRASFRIDDYDYGDADDHCGDDDGHGRCK